MATGRVLTVLLAEAEEVQIPALGQLQAEPPTAHGADQQPFEVMVMAPLPGAVRPTRGYHVLDAVKKLGSDQRLMTALRLDAVPADHAHVQLVAQQPSKAGKRERSSRLIRQAAATQLLEQVLLCELAAGVELEGQLHQRRPVRVWDDHRHIASGDRVANVAIAERRLLRKAAHLGLLHHALLHLGGEVGAVELGHERVDALDESATSGLLDVLGNRDQLHIAALEGGADAEVVLDVAGEAIDLVHHHCVDLSAFDYASQHCLQLRPVRAARRFAAVAVLVDQLPALLVDVAQAGFPLRGDGEALAGEVPVSLFSG